VFPSEKLKETHITSLIDKMSERSGTRWANAQWQDERTLRDKMSKHSGTRWANAQRLAQRRTKRLLGRRSQHPAASTRLHVDDASAGRRSRVLEYFFWFWSFWTLNRLCLENSLWTSVRVYGKGGHRRWRGWANETEARYRGLRKMNDDLGCTH